MGTILQDLKYGLRMLVKNPGFTAVAVISLALGIGANTTIFSFVNALLLRPPAVEAPGRLLEVWNRNMKGAAIEGIVPLTYPDYIYYRDHNQMFSGMLAFDGDPRRVSWIKSGDGEKVQCALVSGNFFSVLGVKPARGRTFRPEEDLAPGAHPVVVLSHAFWQQRLGSDPEALGKNFNFNGTNFTAVGVAPAGFTGILVGLQPDFWAPLAMTLELTRDPNRLTNHNFWLFGTGRLKPGVTRSQAQAELSVLSHNLQQTYPETNQELEAAAFPVTMVPAPFRGYVVAYTGLMMAVVGLVLLIACANSANLLLAQATTRRREMSIRAALGAGRGRLIRQMLIESTLVAVLGGCVAFLLASWLAPALLALKPPSLPLSLDVPLDWRVLSFTLAVSLATGVIFGIAPALRSAKVNVTPGLKGGGVGGTRQSRLRGVLVVAQVAVCLVLLISAGLCVRSLLNAQSLDPGFDTEHVIIARLDPGNLGYSETKGRAFYQQLIERVETLPAVTSASWAGYLPLASVNMTLGIEIEGQQPVAGKRGIGVNVTDVGPGYFATVGTPLLRGREFSAVDGPEAPRTAIINEAMAKRFWPGQDPIGRHVSMKGPEGPKSRENFEIIGVVKTGKYRSLSESPLPFMYRSIIQFYHPAATLVVRTTGDPHGLLPTVRREVQALDPIVVPYDLATMKEYMALPLFPAHTTGLLLGGFGFLALMLAVGGLYGVMSYTVSQRTHEIGIRVALGAGQHDVLKLVVGQGMLLTLIGIAIGLLGAIAVTRALASLLYGIRPTDPVTFAAVSLVLAAVAFAASYIPARRATKVDLIVALRSE